MLSNIMSRLHVVTVLALSLAVVSKPTRGFRHHRPGNVGSRGYVESKPLKQFNIRNHPKRATVATTPKNSVQPGFPILAEMTAVAPVPTETLPMANLVIPTLPTLSNPAGAVPTFSIPDAAFSTPSLLGNTGPILPTVIGSGVIGDTPLPTGIEDIPAGVVKNIPVDSSTRVIGNPPLPAGVVSDIPILTSIMPVATGTGVINLSPLTGTGPLESLPTPTGMIGNIPVVGGTSGNILGKSDFSNGIIGNPSIAPVKTEAIATNLPIATVGTGALGSLPIKTGTAMGGIPVPTGTSGSISGDNISGPASSVSNINQILGSFGSSQANPANSVSGSGTNLKLPGTDSNSSPLTGTTGVDPSGNALKVPIDSTTNTAFDHEISVINKRDVADDVGSDDSI